MGSPLGPVLANIFMCHFEEKWVLNARVRPSSWYRYVDDTFTLFDSKDTANEFLRHKNKPDTPVATVPKKDIIILLPYLGLPSIQITKRLKSCVSNFYSFVNLKIIFQNTRRIKSFFPYKDRLNRSQRSKVIYKASCWDCDDVYIGKTKRRLHDRKTEHFKALTKCDHPSAIADHIKATGHNIKWDHFEILASGKTDLHCKIKETLYIHELQPSLNANVGSERHTLATGVFIFVLSQLISSNAAENVEFGGSCSTGSSRTLDDGCSISDDCSTITCKMDFVDKPITFKLEVNKCDDPVSVTASMDVPDLYITWSHTYTSDDIVEVPGFTASLPGVISAGVYVQVGLTPNDDDLRLTVKLLAGGVFAWWHEMNDASKGAMVGGSILFVIVMISYCYCCCCRSRTSNQGTIIVQPAVGMGPAVMATSTNTSVPMGPLVHQT
ncbi:hypothetical protein ACROYT_G029589 [Oculina patagonica]